MRPLYDEEKEMIIKYRTKNAKKTLLLSIAFIVFSYLMKYHATYHVSANSFRAPIVLACGLILLIPSLITLIMSKNTVNKMEVQTVQIIDFCMLDKKRIGAKIIMQTSNGPEEKKVEVISGQENTLSENHCGFLYCIKDKPYYIASTGDQIMN